MSARPCRAPALGAGGLAVYGGWIEPRRLVVRRHALELPRWPAALAGLRVGVLSDLHAASPHAGEDAIARWVARMNAEAPDLVLLAGDFTDAHWLFGRRLAPERIAERLAALERRSAPSRCWATTTGRRTARACGRALADAGIPVLENDAHAIDAPGRAPARRRAGGRALRRPDVARALAGVPDGRARDRARPRPRRVPVRAVARRAHRLAGTPTAARWRSPTLRRPVVPVAPRRALRPRPRRRARPAPRGLLRLGTSGLPVRLLAPPELLVLELRPEAG